LNFTTPGTLNKDCSWPAEVLFFKSAKANMSPVNPTFPLKGIIFALTMVRLNSTAFLHTSSNSFFYLHHDIVMTPVLDITTLETRANVTKGSESDRNRTLIRKSKGQANAVLCMYITQGVKRCISSAKHLRKYFHRYVSI
jgi:hypothetical protein